MMLPLLALTWLWTAGQCWSPPHNDGSIWPPTNAGYTPKIKTFWFGANHTGLDAPETLALMARHAVAGYGWQTGGVGAESVGRGEANGAAAVAYARDYMESVGNNHTVLFQYRQVQVAERLFAQNVIAVNDPADSGFWIKNESGSTCLARMPWSTFDPYWDFRNDTAVAYWLEHVIGQLADDSSMQGRISAVFFDEVDQGQCGYRCATCDFSKLDLASIQNASITMYAQMVAALNIAGIVPILSLDNRMSASSEGLSGLKMPCAVPEERLVEALQGLSWARFYENWPGSFWVGGGPDVDAAMIANAILEANASIPTALHGGGQACPAPPRNITRPGPLGGENEFLIASYLIVASPGTTLSISHGWYDEDFCWHPEFDVEYGTPVGPATRTGPHSWFRNYTRANAEIDVSKGRNGSVMLLK